MNLDAEIKARRLGHRKVKELVELQHKQKARAVRRRLILETSTSPVHQQLLREVTEKKESAAVQYRRRPAPAPVKKSSPVAKQASACEAAVRVLAGATKPSPREKEYLSEQIALAAQTLRFLENHETELREFIKKKATAK